MMSKGQWIADLERIGENFASDRITREEAEGELRAMHFTPAEIAEHLDAIEAEKG